MTVIMYFRHSKLAQIMILLTAAYIFDVYHIASLSGGVKVKGTCSLLPRVWCDKAVPISGTPIRLWYVILSCNSAQAALDLHNTAPLSNATMRCHTNNYHYMHPT